MGEFWTSLGLLGIAPVDGGTYLYASCAAPLLAEALRSRDAAGFAAAWRRELPVAAPVLQGLQNWDGILVNEVIEVRCPRFDVGKLAVLGDAAHAMAPNLGQGANSALVDAAVLAHELRGPGSLREALQRYGARRRPAVTRVQRQASQLMRLAHVRRPAVRRVRDRTLTSVARLAGDRAARAVQQEDPAWLLATIRDHTSA
jgi:2-polyprenyl-6-methoxyphenol hydroxylase-like FAD-dependent oxidoreductase